MSQTGSGFLGLNDASSTMNISRLGKGKRQRDRQRKGQLDRQTDRQSLISSTSSSLCLCVCLCKPTGHTVGWSGRGVGDPSSDAVAKRCQQCLDCPFSLRCVKPACHDSYDWRVGHRTLSNPVHTSRRAMREEAGNPGSRGLPRSRDRHRPIGAVTRGCSCGFCCVVACFYEHDVILTGFTVSL